MLEPRIMRAARALLEWEQSDLAKAAGLSIATIRKIEQGRAPVREATANEIKAAFDKAGLQLILDGPSGGIGVRLKGQIDEEMYGHLQQTNKAKCWNL